MFIQARLRFLIGKKGSKEATDKKLQRISEFIHMQAATIDNFNDRIHLLAEPTGTNGIKHFLDKFPALFKP